MSTTNTTPLSLDQVTKASQLLSDDQIRSYWQVISSENKGVNLVSRETTFETFRKLVIESILPLSVLDQNFPGYIDIGSGGGLPAIPLILTGRVRQPIDLYERIGKKADALARIVEQLGLFAKVRGENFGEKPAGDPVSLITLRLVAPEQRLIRQIVMNLNHDGVFIYYGLKTLPPLPGFRARRYSLPDSSDTASPPSSEPRGFTILSR